MGLTIVTGSLVYYFKYILVREDLMTVGLAILLLSAMACIPVSGKLSEKIGKGGQYILGMSIVTVAVLLIFGLGHRACIPFVFAMMLLAGIGMSAHYVMPWSIFPDTVEYGYQRTGERNEGMYYGIMNHRTVLHRRQCRARLLSPHPRTL